MTKNEFMTRLMNELHRRNVADAADVAEEYEQHLPLSWRTDIPKKRSPPSSARRRSWPRSLRMCRRQEPSAPPF